jgi:hypothetical protein
MRSVATAATTKESEYLGATARFGQPQLRLQQTSLRREAATPSLSDPCTE